MNGTHGIAPVTVKRARPGFWWSVGEMHQVTMAPYGATEDGTYACCNCAECRRDRAGKALLPVYLVASGPHRGSIIFVEDCEAAA